jgi:phosphate transport system protein
MTVHMIRDIEGLKKRILALGAQVEESLQRAVRSVTERDERMAAEVIEADQAIDDAEVDVEEECLKILALHQPVAIDLRFIVAILKINSDLERIGDLAVNIAEHGKYLAARERIDIPFDFSGMAAKAHRMLKRSLDSLVNMDAALANEVCESDDEVDRINREMYSKVEESIRRTPDRLDDLIRLFAISRHVERIADHATNIAEDVIYMTAGEIVRHRMHEFEPEES